MNTFGKLFKCSIFGESHGNSVGIIIDGCPTGILLKEKDLVKDLNRRKPGKPGTSKRIEQDKIIIESGVYNNKTSGSPICIRFENKNIDSKVYSKQKYMPRPGHADFTSTIKYNGFNDLRGGGHFSGRLTLPLVAAGVIAKKIIKPINIKANIHSIGGQKKYDKLINQLVDDGDSVGGLIECRAGNMPIGLGEPFFDSLESIISHLIFSIPAIKGVEFGAGFKVAEMRGSECNDEIIDKSGKTKTNYSGGINGGISNGNDLIFRVAVKPPSSISKTQKTYNFKSNKLENMQLRGRHDCCIALRIPVIIEAVTAIAIADLSLINKVYDKI